MSTVACTCKHEFQDATYSKGRRAWTPVNKPEPGCQVRCTVCSALHPWPSNEPAKHTKLKKFLAKK